MKNLPYFRKVKLVFVFLFGISFFLQSCTKEEVKPLIQKSPKEGFAIDVNIVKDKPPR